LVVADLESPELDPADAHYLRSVLRLRPGEAVSATDGRGGFRRLVWRGGGALDAEGEVVREPRRVPTITVAFAPVKGDRPEWAVQKLTELGVDRVVLLRTDRTVVRWEGDRAAGHLERLGRIARGALMQSRGRWLPELDTAEFGSFTGADRDGTCMATPAGAAGPSLDRPTVLVGPEGGWSVGEESSGLEKVGLGPNVLRAETAAVVAGVLLCSLRAGLVSPA
jgi:16S rRNA (uracil1498-N3)-methyltransferase